MQRQQDDIARTVTTILVDGEEIGAQHFDLQQSGVRHKADCAPAGTCFVIDTPIPLAELEQRYIAWVVTRFAGERNALAKRLELSPRTLYRKLAASARTEAKR